MTDASPKNARAYGDEMKPLAREVEELLRIENLTSDGLPDRLRRIADGVEREDFYWQSIDTAISGDMDVTITFRSTSKLVEAVELEKEKTRVLSDPAISALAELIEERILRKLRRNGISVK